MTTRATASIAVAGSASSRAFDMTRRRASVNAVKVRWCEWPVNESTLHDAGNYAASLAKLQRFEEAKSLLRKTIPVARRVLGENNERTLRMRWIYARTLYEDPGATLDDLRETLTTLEEIEPVARRVLGGAHPITVDIERDMRNARDAVEGG